MRKVMIAAVLMCCAGSGAYADGTKKVAVVKDPNRMVCRSEEVIGSRLGSKKHCMTAIQWDQLERENRDTVNRIESTRPTLGN